LLVYPHLRWQAVVEVVMVVAEEGRHRQRLSSIQKITLLRQKKLFLALTILTPSEV